MPLFAFLFGLSLTFDSFVISTSALLFLSASLPSIFLKAKDNLGRNALHRCCVRGHHELAKVLLEYGLGVNDSTMRGNTPVALATEGCHVETVRMLILAGAELNTIPDFGGW